VDGAQLVPTTAVDVQALDADYLAFSFHKLFAPFGVGVLYAKESIRQRSLPFLYGGDMIAEGQVTPSEVGYNELPWKFSAGTPNILGVIASAQTLRFVADLADPTAPRLFGTEDPVPRTVVTGAVARIAGHSAALTDAAMAELSTVPGVRIYGPPNGTSRAPLVAFNVAGMSPFALAEALNARGVESRAGCHCATLAHHDLGLDPPASCRLSFAVYNTASDVDRAVSAVHDAVRARVSIGV
jgi:cysteine desulfurase/selenocysteine lyase